MGRPRHPLRADAERRLRIGQGTKDVANALGLHQSQVSKWKTELVRETASAEAIRRVRRNDNERGAGGAAEERDALSVLGVEPFPDPIPFERLCPEARRALDDFGYFRRRYFGRVSTPWQEESGYKIAELVETPQREYAVENCPPEAGKSTLYHDVVCWLINRTRVLNRRTLSVLYITASGKLVADYVDWVRRDLTSPFPVQGDPEEIELGLAFDAETTLGEDFGRFQPRDGSLWQRDAFRVEEIGGGVARRKEPTVAGYGLDAKFIGFRADLVLPDDIVDELNAKEGTARDSLVAKWDGVIERRLNARGVLFLVGQRLGPADLYRYCLEKKAGKDRYNDDGSPRKKYHHIKYQAYYPELDTGDPALLARDAPPYRSPEFRSPSEPVGPLLDPRRLDWDMLDSIWASTPETFEVVYQQGESAAKHRLIQEVWAWGGTDLDGVLYPGCEDRDRRWGEIPLNLAPPVVSLASIDPSGVNKWGFIWRLWQPEVGLQHLVELSRARYEAGEVITYDPSLGRCTGMMPDWQEMSVAAGYPITHWIVEINAAQRFLLAHDYVRQWMALNNVLIIPHTTARNKIDPNLGVQATLPPLFKYGKIRIPSRHGDGGYKSIDFVQEHRDWTPERKKGTDLVMANWIPQNHLPALAAPDAPPRQWRPSWMRRGAA